MGNSNSTTQFLRTECRRTVEALYYTQLLFAIGGVVMTAFFMFHGVLEPVVANSTYALCSTALIGLGLLRSRPRNLPVSVGTAIAVLAAAYALSQALSTHPDQRVPLMIAFGALVVGGWTILMSFGGDFLNFTAANSGWLWRAAAFAYTLIVFSIPFTLVILAVLVSAGE